MNHFPLTLTEYLDGIARETVRMSYPGRMGGIVKTKTKRDVLQPYFTTRFPLKKVWKNADHIAERFDKWHGKRVREMGGVLKKQVKKDYHAEAVAAKFLNTFLYQLMKYEQCRPLWNQLHLPLDNRVFKALKSLDSPTLEPIKEILGRSAYSLSLKEYGKVQMTLWKLIEELNERPVIGYQLKSRIELNVLWAKGR